MKFRSTREISAPVTLTEALKQGLASDGGLFVPVEFPVLSMEKFEGLVEFSDIASRMLQPFFEGDALRDSLPDICRKAFDFPIPLKMLKNDTAVLELFHGPTAAFKDVGARFLAECLTHIQTQESASKKATVMVATSGDTGGAVAAAFHRKPDVDVVILFPKGRVSARQEHQLTAWGDNVRAFAVLGDFDDCQRMVKAAFLDPWWKKNRRLISANSINLGRLLPQMAYYAAASLWYLRQTGSQAGMIVPSGNLGNSVAALWAKKTGFPIRRVVLATNANSAVRDYLMTGRVEQRTTVSTLANAMDVGSPSNLERLIDLYPRLELLRRDVMAISVTDLIIQKMIREGIANWGEIWCPHTATAVYAREGLASPHWILIATAHPAKFESVVEPLIGMTLELPASLREILARPAEVTEISPELSALQVALER